MEEEKNGSLGRFCVRTDLALEESEAFEARSGEKSGIYLREQSNPAEEIKLTRVTILNERGEQALGKPMGEYLTIEANRLAQTDEEYHNSVSLEFARQLRRMIEEVLGNVGNGVLVVGLGNASITPDSLGPRVVGNLCMTRHLPKKERAGSLTLSGIVPGVMAQTGMETAELLRGVVEQTKPGVVVVIDALAARSVHRLGTTIQLTNTGICPGSGVGNHREGLTKERLGVPVIAVGVPTVIGVAAIVQDTVNALTETLARSEVTRRAGEWMETLDEEGQYHLISELLEPKFSSLYVTPPDIDETIRRLSFTISEGIHTAIA